MLSRPESRLRMAEIIGTKLNISKEKVKESVQQSSTAKPLPIPNDRFSSPLVCCCCVFCMQALHFCHMYQPGITLSEPEASVGRVTLPRKQSEAVQLSV